MILKKIFFYIRYNIKSTPVTDKHSATEVYTNSSIYSSNVLDMIKLQDDCLAYEVDRKKEFAPVKNKTGVDSVDTARELLKFNGVEI